MQKYLVFTTLAFTVGCNTSLNVPTNGALSTTNTTSGCSLSVTPAAANYCSVVSGITSPTLYGDGSRTNPYRICSPYQFNAIQDNPTYMSSHFLITADLDMSCITGNHNPIGSSLDDEHSFRGVFEGSGYSIENWTNISPATDYVAPFSSLIGGAVRHITFTNLSIMGGDYTGGAVGYTYGGHVIGIKTSGSVVGNNYVGGVVAYQALGAIEQSSSDASVAGLGSVGGILGRGETSHINSSKFTGSVSASATGAGGILGYSNFGHIENSYSNGTVTSSAGLVGGIAGRVNGNIFNSYSAGTVTGTTNVGGLVGHQYAQPIKNSFSTAEVYGTGGTAANVGVIRGAGTGSISNSYYLSTAICDADMGTGGVQACGTTSTGSYATAADFYSSANEPLTSWDFTVETVIGTNDYWIESSTAYPEGWFTVTDNSSPGLNGTGTIDDPFLISSEDEFLLISSNPRWMGKHYRLTANLNFHNETYQRFSGPSSAFYGTFDGDGFKLENISLINEANAQYLGAFGFVIYPGHLYDFDVENISIVGSLFNGGAVGALGGKVENISSSGSVRATYHAGGLVGLTLPNAEVIDANSSVMMNNLAASAIGGLIGNNTAKLVSKSFATGDVFGVNSYGGGLVGTQSRSGGAIENCYATGNVSLSSSGNSYFGGLIGYVPSIVSITNSYATGNVVGKNFTGGLIGNAVADVVIMNSFAAGEVTSNGDSTKVGPIVGNTDATLINVYYYSGATCDSSSATGGLQDCNTYASGFHSNLNDFYQENSYPMYFWDFDDTWITDSSSFPVLQTN